jgi:tRNA uridine 5-carboxymethylaminomethyl modification enzyme
LGQAARISGVTPAAISLLLIHLKRGRFKGFADTSVGSPSGVTVDAEGEARAA